MGSRKTWVQVFPFAAELEQMGNRQDPASVLSLPPVLDLRQNQPRILGRFRQLDSDEVRGWVKIVLRRLVDYPQITFRGSAFVADDLIDFAFFKVFTISVVDAKGEPKRSLVCVHGL
jgi:hypothetical protein